MSPKIIVQIREAEDLKQPLDQDLRPATFLFPTSQSLYSASSTSLWETSI